jgi:hypothetical protein
MSEKKHLKPKQSPQETKPGVQTQKVETNSESTAVRFFNHGKKNKDKKEITRSEEIGKDLKKIYQNDQGKLPNMTKLELGNRNRLRNVVVLIIASLLIILTVALIGFFVFQPTVKFSNEKIQLDIKAPFSVTSGQKINYQIKLSNLEAVSLTRAQLIISLPAGFIYDSSNVQPQTKQDESGAIINSNVKIWTINNLGSGESKIIELNGVLLGTPDSKQVISATFSYTPSNFNSEFQKNSVFTSEINDTALNSTLEFPAQVADQEIVEFSYKLKNNSIDQPLHDLKIELNYPAEFTLQTSKIDAKDNQTPLITDEIKLKSTSPKDWSINSLLPQEEKELKFKGKFKVTETKSLDLNLAVSLKGSGEDSYEQKNNKATVQVIKGDLLTNLIIDGANQNKAVDFGQTMNYLINLQNKSKKTLGDVKVRAVIDSPLLDWTSLKDEQKGSTEDNQILWTKDQIPALALLLPESEVNINFQINLKNYQKSSKYKNDDYQVKNFFEAQINKIDNADANVVVQSNTIINEINSDLSLDSAVKYFDSNSQTIGSGPLPPIVGQKTSYKIFWTLTNSRHELKDIIVKANLPDYVTLEDPQNLSTGNLYLSKQNEIIWTINRLPQTINQATAEFEISITPQAKDVQKILNLFGEVTATATDAATQGNITKNVQGMTTNLDTDPLAKGKGLIQEAQ